MRPAHTLLFLDQNVEILRKSRARRTTLSLRPDRGMRVVTNRSTSLKEIEEFLLKHVKWIEKNLATIEKQNESFKKPTLTEGSLFPFLGELKHLTFVDGKSSRNVWAIEEGFLICRQTPGLTASELEKKLFAFYKTQAILHLTQKVEHWSGVTGLTPSRLRFGRATTRWGSCNSQGVVTLNWKLICHAPLLIDYVILHELCHLKHLNHSEKFWELVAFYNPEYQTYEKILDAEVGRSRFLNFHVSN